MPTTSDLPEAPAITIEAVLAAINSGEFDTHLNLIKTVVAARDKTINPPAKPGDKGTLTNVRPKYLDGAPLTVIRKNRTRLVVRIDQDWLDANPQAKARWSGEITCTPDQVASAA